MCLNRRVRHLEATIPADRMVEAGVSIIESRGGMQAANEAAGAGTAALANPYPSYTSAFRFTNGNINHGDVYATTRATISFNPALCWYLDSTFCSSFHTVKATMGADAANALFSALVFSCFALGAFIFFLHFLQIAQRVLSEGFVGAAHPRKNRQTRKRFMMAVMAALKQQPMWLWGLKLTLLVCPITFYAQVLLPCFNCYDFEAAATHEIGHVLGLSHPDTDFEASLCGSSYCTQPGVNSYNASARRRATYNATVRPAVGGRRRLRCRCLCGGVSPRGTARGEWCLRGCGRRSGARSHGRVPAVDHEGTHAEQSARLPLR